MNQNYYAVIMAGGVGSRFWPLSTTSYPKQFHDMLGSGETLLQKTFGRLTSFIPANNILILTNENYNQLVLEQLPMIQQNQVVLEPAMRNTAPCILYAALKIHKMNPNALMIVAPSDHWIEDETAFAKDVTLCFEKCNQENVLCTLGIKPTFPNTGFGYIEYKKDAIDNQQAGLRKVQQFREKPDYKKAKSFLAQGNFLWNGGIFIWRADSIIEAFKIYQPALFALFQSGMATYNTVEENTFIGQNYPLAENISIDYAILEKSPDIFVLPAGFDWNDLGTWGSLYDKLGKDKEENAIVSGKVLVEDARGNMIRADKDKLVVVDGLEDYIIVDKKEVLLIYPKIKEQDIKKLVAKVKSSFGTQYV